MAIASGAGSGAQNAIGVGVIGGMMAATFLVPVLTPFFFVGVNNLFSRLRRKPTEHSPQAEASHT